MYQVKLPVFEGPFDALFYLIQKAEVDIYEIPLARITDDYLAYLRTMEELNLDIASEFLVMAATLLKLKSQRLLPPLPCAEATEEEDLFGDITTQEELIARIMEYKKFQEVARALKTCENSQRRVYVRSFAGRERHEPDFGGEFAGDDVSLSHLFSALQDVLKNIEVRIEEIEEEEYSVLEIMNEMSRKIVAAGPEGMKFTQLFSVRDTKTKVILSFFSLLELIRRKKVKVWQEGSFSLIYIRAC